VPVTEELNQILESLDKGKAGTIQIRNYTATVKGILEREPKNPLALYVKAKLLIHSANPQDRFRIKPEVLSLVNDMAANAHSVVYYHRKFTLLNELNVHDDDVYQEQKNVCLDILKTPRNIQSGIYHRTAEGFLGREGPITLKADFIVDKTSGKQPFTVQFSDRSVGNPQTWNWEFGDGSSSRETNPVHTYNNNGQYSVTLTVTKNTDKHIINKKELIHVLIQESSITDKPRANFTADPSAGKPPLSVQFFDRSVGNPQTWSWEFGDGNSSRETNPIHTYNNNGQYSVTLTVTNKAGTDKISKDNLIRVAVQSQDSLVPVRPSDGPDPEMIYENAIKKMVQDYPEIADLILAGPHKKMQLKGYILDAFEGETPKEFYTLINCVDEEVPLVILENKQEKTKLNARIETKKVSLKNKGLSSEFVDWAVEVWKLSIINENVKNGRNSGTPPDTDSDIIF